MIVFILLVIIIYKILDFERRVEDLEHKVGNLSYNYDPTIAIKIEAVTKYLSSRFPAFVRDNPDLYPSFVSSFVRENPDIII
jgi:hypothetical protein